MRRLIEGLKGSFSFMGEVLSRAYARSPHSVTVLAMYGAVAAQANLRPLLEDPGFSPKDRDVPALTGMLAEADDELVAKLTRALLRKPDAAARSAAAQL